MYEQCKQTDKSNRRSYTLIRIIFVISIIFIHMCNILQIVVCPFVLFPLVIVLSIRLRFTDSDYPFGLFKHFIFPILRFVHLIKYRQCIKRLVCCGYVFFPGFYHCQSDFETILKVWYFFFILLNITQIIWIIPNVNLVFSTSDEYLLTLVKYNYLIKLY